MSEITRRDFINGTLVAAGTSILSFDATSQAAMAALEPSYYPPARTGLRGSHPGSNDHAHSRAWAGRSDWGPTTKLSETYDLVVVGGGLSGLAAASRFEVIQDRHWTPICIVDGKVEGWGQNFYDDTIKIRKEIIRRD